LRPPPAGGHALLQLQRTIGNRAVQRLLQSGRVRPKLRIGPPGDQYEREAERVADHIMCMPGPTVQPIRAGEGGPVQGQRVIAGNAAVDVAPAVVHDVLRSPGQPLAPSTRAFFEPRFGHDFSRVRIHADTPAAQSARSINALAYTVEGGIVFGAGQYAPETEGGKRLLAHELTHVVQQNPSGSEAVLFRQKSPAPRTKRPAAGKAEAEAAGTIKYLAHGSFVKKGLSKVNLSGANEASPRQAAGYPTALTVSP
jgi:hypothetical protein